MHVWTGMFLDGHFTHLMFLTFWCYLVVDSTVWGPLTLKEQAASVLCFVNGMISLL